MSRFQAPWTANGPLIRVGLIDFLEGGETIAEFLALYPCHLPRTDHGGA